MIARDAFATAPEEMSKRSKILLDDRK